MTGCWSLKPSPKVQVLTRSLNERESIAVFVGMTQLRVFYAPSFFFIIKIASNPEARRSLSGKLWHQTVRYLIGCESIGK